MAATNVQAFPGNVTVSDAIIADNGTKHSLTIDASSSQIYNKVLQFTSISANSYNYVGRFSIYAPPAIFSIVDGGSALGSGSRYSMAKHYGANRIPIVNALEGSHYTKYTFVWQANGEMSYDVWFQPNRAGTYTVYVHAADYTFPTAPESPTYRDVLYGLVNLSDGNGGLAHAIIGAPGAYGNASLQLFNNGQTTNNRLTHEAIQLFSNATPATGAISNVYITMTPSSVNNGYGGYIEGWVKAGTTAGLTIGSVNQGTKYAGITVLGTTPNVGIGTTNPQEALHVAGSMRLGAAEGVDDDNLRSIVSTSPLEVHSNAEDLDGLGVNLNLRSGFSDSESNIQMLSSKSNSTFQYISFATATTERMRILTNGDVGIGTNGPNMKLDCYVGSTAYEGIQVRSSSGAYAKLIANPSANGHNNIVRAGDLGIVFSTDNSSTSHEAGKGFYIAPWSNTTSGLRIDENGNVGIGTNAPQTLVDINGTTRIGGALSQGHAGYNFAQSMRKISVSSGGDMAFTFNLRLYCNWIPILIKINVSSNDGNSGQPYAWSYTVGYRGADCGSNNPMNTGGILFSTAMDGADPGADFLSIALGGNNVLTVTTKRNGRDNIIAVVEVIAFGGIYL